MWVCAGFSYDGVSWLCRLCKAVVAKVRNVPFNMVNMFWGRPAIRYTGLYSPHRLGPLAGAVLGGSAEHRLSSAQPAMRGAVRAGWGRQVLLDRATAEARVGTSGLLPVVGHSMRPRSPARAVGRQHAQWGRTANAALSAWPAVQAAAPPSSMSRGVSYGRVDSRGRGISV